MIGSLIPHLSTLIVTVRRNMLSSVMTTLMILSIIIAWSARGNIATWLEQNPSAEQKADRVKRSIESDNKITLALRQDREKLNADRVIIRQFHDYADPKSPTPVPSISVTYAVVAPGVSTPPNATQPQPRTYFTDVMGVVWADPANPVCAKHHISEIKNPNYRDMLQQAGVAVLYTCPIVGIDGQPVGVIMASYLTTEKQHPSDEAIFTTLKGTGVRVAGYLAEVTAPERENWYRKVLDS